MKRDPARLPDKFIFRSLDQARPGDTVWMLPEALYVDHTQRCWINHGMAALPEKSDQSVIKVRVTTQGYIVDITGASDYRWARQLPALFECIKDRKWLAPVIELIYE